MRPRRSREGAAAHAWTAALLLGLMTVPACGPGAAGNLYAPGHLGVASPSQVGRPVGIGGPWLCSNGTGPMRLISIEPVTRVGELDLRVGVHRISTARPTDLVGGGDEPLPASYGPVDGAEVPACRSDHRLVVGLEATRLSAPSAAVAGLRIRYAEGGNEHRLDADMNFGLCGAGGASNWPGTLGTLTC